MTRTLSLVLVLSLAACGPKLDGQGCPEDVPVTDACSIDLSDQGACNDEGGCWAKWGLEASESCNCPTTDAGKDCAADTDCEGMCIVAGSPTSKEGCVTTTGGTCSDMVIMYGCFCYLDDKGQPDGVCAD